mgnify:CR=1 FL=1
MENIKFNEEMKSSATEEVKNIKKIFVSKKKSCSFFYKIT